MTALRSLCRAVGWLPWRWLRWPGGALGLLVGSILRVRRRHVELAMARAGISSVPRTARGMYASLGTALLEFLWMVGRGTTPAFAVRLTDRARAAIRRPDGRGIVIATAHTGNWDLVACTCAQGELSLSVVTKRLSVGWLDRIWQDERAARGIELLHGEGVFAAALVAVARGRAVAVLVDQAPERASAVVETSFLGEKARCDAMPALLAARGGAPLVLALGRRGADGVYEVDVPLVLEPPEHARGAWVADATRAINQRVESFVFAHPDQWLWLHRRWKPATPAAALRPDQVVLSLLP
jgi:KDO2-lipid IV(A) lauroyltransferase